MSIKTATLNGVATIEIARPEKKNALTRAMYQAMADALIAANTDPAVRAVLISGQPLDMIHIGLFHDRQELPRIGRQ